MPYVGAGRDGCLRSAQIDREEADGLSQDDPRRPDLIASAEQWEAQARDIRLRCPSNHAEFVESVAAYEDGVRQRIGPSDYADSAASERRRLGGKLRNELLAESLAGLDLEPAEWSLMQWFLSWDSQETLASIIRKAREQGPVSS
jgi:hypothetical protein